MSRATMVQSLSTSAKEGLQLLQNWMKGSPQAVKQAATRLGLDPSKSTISNVISAAKDNPVTTALLLMEAGDIGVEVLDSMAEQSPEIAALIDRFGLSDDTVTSATPLSDIVKLQDEFAVIKQASSLVGGYSRLLTLRRALQLDLSVYQTFETIKNLKV